MFFKKKLPTKTNTEYIWIKYDNWETAREDTFFDVFLAPAPRKKQNGSQLLTFPGLD